MVNATKESFDEDDLAKFQELLLDAEKPLYKGCPDFTKMSAIVKLLNLKGKYGASDKFFTELLGLLKKLLPADSHAWRTIDEKFPKIPNDLRNLRLGISANGVDVNSGTRHHSVWPVLFVIYNLHPWLCTKRKFIMLSVLISGYPRNDIDVFLESLVDDLHTLFETGFDTYDASTKENFNLCDVVLWTINDYPTLGTLCGCPYSRFKEKNVCESLVRTLLNVSGKTKDGMNARLDLAELGIKPELFAREEEDKTTLPLAGYTLMNAKKTSFVKRYPTSGYHKAVFQISLVWKEIRLQELDKLQLELVVTLCLLNKFFPPSFFDIMIHLTVHLAGEATQASLKTKNPSKQIALLENKHSKSFAKWLRKEMLMQGTSLTKQERECKLYDAFDKFAYQKGETLRDFYLGFSLLLNDMNMYNMKLEQFQVNTKFLNTLPSEWSKFITDVKLVRDLHTTNVDQLHAYLGQHEYHANEVRLMNERTSDPLALITLSTSSAVISAVSI
nr:hypothetical protein [Tanacetum cinerariifolium]